MTNAQTGNQCFYQDIWAHCAIEIIQNYVNNNCNKVTLSKE
jgi:hypothetical protein